MSDQSSPETANRVVTFTKPIKHEQGDVTVAEPRIMVRGGVSRAAPYLVPIDSFSQELPPVTAPEPTEKSVWSSALDFIAEGLTACSASFYPPMAYLNAGDGVLDEVPPRETSAANKDRVTLYLVPNPAQRTEDDSPAENGLAMATAAPSPQEIEPRRRWNWLSSCCEVVAAIWAHKRRERKIRQAINALAALDDSTLKELGIHDRDQIEDAVRYGNDC